MADEIEFDLSAAIQTSTLRSLFEDPFDEATIRDDEKAWREEQAALVASDSLLDVPGIGICCEEVKVSLLDEFNPHVDLSSLPPGLEPPKLVRCDHTNMVSVYRAKTITFSHVQGLDFDFLADHCSEEEVTKYTSGTYVVSGEFLRNCTWRKPVRTTQAAYKSVT